MRDIDTLVIGGGIAGLSAAARLARHGSTVVLEAEDAVGFHSSGRSATFCHFGIGGDLVRKLTAMSREVFARASGEARVARTHPALFIARADEEERLDALARATALHVSDAERIAGDDLTAIVPVLRRGSDGFVAGLLDRRAFKLDSDALLQTNIRELRAAGGEVALASPAEAIRREGERWIVDTRGESYSAHYLVNAAGAWADEIAIRAGVAPLGLRPLRRTIIQFEPPEGVDVSAWPFTKTVGEGFYFLPEGPARLLASPMDETPTDPCDAQPEEEDIALAAWRVEQGTTMTIRHIEHKWSGLRTFAPDNAPVAGFAPGAPGFFWLAGQGGFGLQTSPAMAMAAEALMLGLAWPEELAAFGISPEEFSPNRFAA
ncbi:MAG: FAD-binding oxidoreductase [Sphingomonadaceae bacterium]|nr:FAD-binding oxidoreductase [Sphingomonadaceae bacterium]